MAKKTLSYQGKSHSLETIREQDGLTSLQVDGEAAVSARVQQLGESALLLLHSQGQSRADVVETASQIFVAVAGRQFIFDKPPAQNADLPPGAEAVSDSGNDVSAPMPGKILKFSVSEGDTVKAGQQLFILEAMKMENEVKALRDGTIKAIRFQVNDLVSVGDVVIELHENAE